VLIKLIATSDLKMIRLSLLFLVFTCVLVGSVGYSLKSIRNDVEDLRELLKHTQSDHFYAETKLKSKIQLLKFRIDVLYEDKIKLNREELLKINPEDFEYTEFYELFDQYKPSIEKYWSDNKHYTEILQEWLDNEVANN
jgi:hypothetical protein